MNFLKVVFHAVLKYAHTHKAFSHTHTHTHNALSHTLTHAHSHTCTHTHAHIQATLRKDTRTVLAVHHTHPTLLSASQQDLFESLNAFSIIYFLLRTIKDFPT